MGCWSCFGEGKGRRYGKTKDEGNSCNSETRMVQKPETTNMSESVQNPVPERRTSVSAEPETSRPSEKSVVETPTLSNSKVFPYKTLVDATENFRDESFIGQGGFGCVYKGKLEGTDQVVAVKKLDQTGSQGEREFLVEVLMLSLMRHPNLVNLVGYCAEGTERLLVYEFMPLGSLETILHDRSPGVMPLSWNTRMMIAMETAKGLNYLHNEAKPPVIYRDLKAANILLDREYHPKLSDFGLAKFGPTGDKTHVSTRIMGTHGYCAPEYATTGKLTSKSDIYSFGVILLELITGRRAMDQDRGKDRLLVAWARPLMADVKSYSPLLDRDLRGQVSGSVLTMVVDVADMCLRENPSQRPLTVDVVSALEFISSCRSNPRKRNKVTETTNVVQKQEREAAVAEAKIWAEAFRENNRRQDKRKEDGVDDGEID